MVALLVNLGVGMIALATGKTSDIILISVFGALTLYSLSSIAVLRLRMREPELPRPYRTPGYPLTPWIALALSLLCIVAMIVRYPTLALVYAAILVGAWGLFLVFVPAGRRSSIV